MDIIRSLPTSRPYGTMDVWTFVLLPTCRPYGTWLCGHSFFYRHYVPIFWHTY